MRQNIRKSEKISKNQFFERKKSRRKEISNRPDLSRPAPFRIQTDKENLKNPGEKRRKKN